MFHKLAIEVGRGHRGWGRYLFLLFPSPTKIRNPNFDFAGGGEEVPTFVPKLKKP